MGQKVNPIAIRMGITTTWKSVWFAPKNKISEYVKFDHDVRTLLSKRLKQCLIDYISIERLASYVKIRILTARPGMIIGRKGDGVASLNKLLCDTFHYPIVCEVVEIKKPDINAQIISRVIAMQLETRAMYRRCMQKAVKSAMKAGATGIKVSIAGRLNNAEMARTEWIKEGRIPLHVFRAKVQYGFSEARTTYGVLGIKVWVFTDEVLKIKKLQNATHSEEHKV